MSPTSYFSSMFGNSPISPLQQHMAKVQTCVLELVPFFEAVLADDWGKAQQVQSSITAKEHEADTLKKELRLHLPKGLFMPVSRRDLLEVLTMQDKIANKTKDIAGLVLGRKIHFPTEIHQQLLEFVKRSIDASAKAQEAINELDELVATGFRGNEVELVESILKKLDKIESDTDSIQVEVRSKLFAQEKELPPVEVMFLYKVIEWIGDLGDIAQRVGSRLELMLAH